ncbi:hypothetical protein AB0I28_06230 [Phytomonospora sp. NPDC050363]|uniref:hypothetical protein n=1 Tax=Phytomonospora sp. NPDC050363 TaxID=3155642 RepID=UPI0033FCF9A4
MRHKAMRVTRFLAVSAAVAATGLILAACGGSSPGDGTAGSSAPGADGVIPGPVTSGSSGDASMPPDDGRVEPGHALQIIVTKTGGFAGIDERLVVAEDGTWEFTGSAGKSEKGALSPELLRRLQTLAVSAELFAPPSKDKPDHQCADMFQYGLTVGDMTTRTDDCGQAPNETFDEMVAIVVEETPI